MFFVFDSYGQHAVLSGQVIDANSSESLIGANVFTADHKRVIATNEQGYFSIELPVDDTVQVVVSYVGYDSEILIIDTSVDSSLIVRLQPSNSIGEIVISDKIVSRKVKYGRVKLTQSDLEGRSMFVGEDDALKVFQLMPGISFGKEGTSNLFVRGGSPDQNLILLDDVPLYNPTHLGGFLSVFDVNALKEINVYKGSLPSRYAGRLSSIVDVRLKDGHAKQWNKEFAVGVLSSKIFVEGPVKGDKTTLLFSARRSFLDLLYRGANLLMGADEDVGFSIYDINFKLNHRIGSKSNLTFQYYKGKDRAIYRSTTVVPERKESYNNSINWGNTMCKVSWSKFGNKYDFKTHLSYSGYDYNLNSKVDVKDKVENQNLSENSSFVSGIRDFGVKSYINYYFDSKLQARFGLEVVHHTFNPQIQFITSGVQEVGLDSTKSTSKIFSLESGIYAEMNYQINSQWDLSGGLHLASYYLPRNHHYGIYSQPRIKLSYQLHQDLLLFSSYSRMNQNSHLLSNSSAGFPSDLWVPATERIPSSTSDQIAIGMLYNIGETYELSAESFYKRMNDLIEYGEGVTFFRGSTDWQDKVVTGGIGTVYGLEFLFDYKFDNWDGYLAYTWSKNERQFSNLNLGKPFPYKYDRRHDVAASISYKPNSKIHLNMTWVYNTGEALTLPTEIYEIYTFDTQIGTTTGLELWPAEVYESRNSYRAPNYHRLDVSCSFTKNIRKGKRVWEIGIYNVYNRINPYYVFYDKGRSGNLVLKKLGLFPILPSISYKRSF